MEPWERLTDEPARAFAAFVVYRDLPAVHRSLVRAAAVACNLDPAALDRLSASDERRHASRRRSFAMWSAEHAWPERATQYDQHLDRIRRGEREYAIREMSDRHALVGRTIVGAALDALHAVIAPTGDDAEPRTIGEASDRVILAFAAEGAKLERAAYGLNIAADEIDWRVASEIAPDVQEAAREILDSAPEVAAAHARLMLARAQARRRQAQEDQP